MSHDGTPEKKNGVPGILEGQNASKIGISRPEGRVKVTKEGYVLVDRTPRAVPGANMLGGVSHANKVGTASPA